MAACFSLPERLQRTRRALSVLWTLLALAVVALALTGFSDYRLALLNVLFWGAVVAQALYLTHLKRRREPRRATSATQECLSVAALLAAIKYVEE
jgi:predicted MFS family arabinose efflux permease